MQCSETLIFKWLKDESDLSEDQNNFSFVAFSNSRQDQKKLQEAPTQSRKSHSVQFYLIQKWLQRKGLFCLHNEMLFRFLSSEPLV